MPEQNLNQNPDQKNHKLLPFIPYLCQPAAILGLVLVGELLALVLALADTQQVLDWSRFGAVSMVIQWIILSCALLLCQLRSWLSQHTPRVSGALAYGLCVLVAAVVLYVAQRVTYQPFSIDQWLQSLLIAAIFSGILLRYLYLQQQLINQQQAESQARIESLQARIRPHFLFNSMNTIASLISVNPAAAETAVENLSEVFRANLQEASLIDLQQEIELCRRYIAIEAMRLDDRLQMVWDFDEPLPTIQVPSLCLQPLLENAIIHGIQRLPEGGKIALTIKSEHKQLHITIVNPVPVLAASQTEQGHQMALANIRNRLQLHYKTKASIVAEQRDQLFVVAITLPLTTVL